MNRGEYWCIDVTRSIHQDLSLRFSCDDWMDKVNKLFIKWTWACNQLQSTTGQRITLKDTTSMSCPFELWYSQVTLVSGCPFWQLSIDHKMDVHNDVHYQVKHRWYMPWTSSLSNARSLQENNAWSLQENIQSDCAHYCSHTCMYNKL